MVKEWIDIIVNLIAGIYCVFFDPFRGRSNGLLKPYDGENWLQRKARHRAELLRQTGWEDAKALCNNGFDINSDTIVWRFRGNKHYDMGVGQYKRSVANDKRLSV